MNAKRGDVDHAFGFKAQPFPKKTAAAGSGTHLLEKGIVLAFDPDDTTKTAYVIAESDAVRPFIVTRGSVFSPTANQYYATDAQGTYYSALETDESVSCVYDGQIVLEFDGDAEAGDYVMPSASNNGHVIKWNGSAENTKVGQYLGRPGYRTGEFIPGAITTGGLGWVRLTP
jgi:hypothetical protein